MTSADLPPPPGPGAAAQKPGSFQRIAGVLTSPSETFASIVRQPDWVIPLVVILVVSLIGGIIFAQRVDFGAPIREAMEQNPNMPADQAERAVKIGSSVAKIFAYCSPVLSVVGLLVISGVLLLACRLMGGEGNFLQAFSVTVYGWMPGLIKSILMIIIIVAKPGVSALDLPTLVRSNLAFLVTMKDHPMLFTVLASLDVFTVWLLALIIIGFAYVSKFSKSKTAAIVISLWVVATLFKLIGPAIRAIRG